MIVRDTSTSLFSTYSHATVCANKQGRSRRGPYNWGTLVPDVADVAAAEETGGEDFGQEDQVRVVRRGVCARGCCVCLGLSV